MQIRAVTAADHAAWLPLWQGYQRFYTTEIAEATSQLTWQRFLDASEPMHAALAWRDGQAIGMVHWIFHRSCWTEGDYCYLQDLFVDEQLRGGGIGRGLIEHVYAQARLAEASRVHWLTHESNTSAMQLYDRIAERPGLVQYRKKL
ncbi:GNAT family N-acetyltransferase [Pseudomonas sp. PA15(2017)]|uniref:GNAT family N-acetyltransferase n=1 Tax=Pseudomonas sp. PA15(2017) TaxID=1932111 RepID=UPI000968A7DF|nr:GNAT family N-acetyltransferase [Pseudomonas sp. PA15(2017)]OLU27433.1 GNAT family N-acetyltransferase [Pseudomonas sp. PA15(2017)]